jgi:hypothetical protein
VEPTTTTTVESTTTTVPSSTTTVPPFIPPASGPAGAAYSCASGAFVLGQPVSSAATWTATVFQPGIANRQVNVVLAFV